MFTAACKQWSHCCCSTVQCPQVAAELHLPFRWCAFPPSWTCQQHLWAQNWNRSRNKPTDTVECFCSCLFHSVRSVLCFCSDTVENDRKGVKVSAHLRAGWLGDEKLVTLLKDMWGFGKWCSLEICEHQRSICTQESRILQNKYWSHESRFTWQNKVCTRLCTNFSEFKKKNP